MPKETTMNSIISDIIAARQNKVEGFRLKRSEFTAILERLEKLLQESEFARQDPGLQPMWTYNPWLETLLKETAPVEQCIADYRAAIRELDHLIGRYSRKSVNIAVVGDSRSGKSKFLQTVSGLDDKCIPSFKGSFCTGVSSVIENDGGMGPEMARAVFTFKTEEEILNEINGKLRKITGGAIQFSTLDQVGRQSAEGLSRQMDSKAQEGERGHISDFIKMYIENFREWSDRICPADSSEAEREYTCEDKSEIQKYVAKHDGGDQKNGGRGAKPFYRYIAVKKAEIYCSFKLTDVNQIRLVDTVGLGDIEDGTTEKMYQAIDRDSDAVLYLFRPDIGKGGIIDDRTYDILNHEMYPRYKNADMRKWMGVVINNDGTNLTECMRFKEIFELNAPEMAQNVAFKEIIDVSQAKDVREYSVLPILASLARNLGDIDARIEKTTGALIETASESFAALKNICREVRVPAQEDIISEKFADIFCGFDKAARSLGRELIPENSGQKRTFLEESLELVSSLKESETADIREEFHYGEPSSQRSLAFGELHRAVRKIGSREAAEFEAMEKDFKRQLACKFLENFGFEKSKCPAPESSTFFLEMAEQLFQQNSDWQMLKDAFLSIHAFKLDETKGITKLLFNENAERFLNSTDGSKQDNAEPADMKSENGQETLPRTPPHGMMRPGTAMPQQPGSAALKKTPKTGDGGRSQDPLVQEMNRQLDLFAEGIRQSPFFEISELIPISRQIDSEIHYFLRFFDFCYHRQWSDVMNRQLREGCLFVDEKQNMDALSGKFERLRHLVNQAIQQ